MNMKQAQVIDAELMIAKWDIKIHELGEKDYTSSLPNANLNDSGTLNVLCITSWGEVEMLDERRRLKKTEV
jgi:hypothetical protein